MDWCVEQCNLEKNSPIFILLFGHCTLELGICIQGFGLFETNKQVLMLFQTIKVLIFANYAFIAQRNLAERARLLVLHSSDDGRIGSGDISR